jgi:hypothetical protein
MYFRLYILKNIQQNFFINVVSVQFYSHPPLNLCGEYNANFVFRPPAMPLRNKSRLLFRIIYIEKALCRHIGVNYRRLD